MKSKKGIIFKVGAIVLLLAIAAVMLIVGRGHTVYFDNKTLDYNGQIYSTPYKVVIYVGDEQVAKLYDDERGMTTCIGQSLTVTMEVTQEKGGAETVTEYAIALPYNMDGIIINLPGYLANLPQEAYLEEFIQVAAEEPEEEEPIVDEFGIETIIEEGAETAE